jgi:hypothetical protein
MWKWYEIPLDLIVSYNDIKGSGRRKI